MNEGLESTSSIVTLVKYESVFLFYPLYPIASFRIARLGCSRRPPASPWLSPREFDPPRIVSLPKRALRHPMGSPPRLSSAEAG